MSRLEGTRVVVTRPRDRADALCALLEAEGAAPILCPTIRIEAADSTEALDDALRRLAGYRWVVFTSASAVDAVLARAPDGLAAPATTRVACVGSATADALRAHGIAVDHAPAEFTGARLGETLEPVAGERVLFPRGDLGGDTLTAALRARGATVDDVVVYRTVVQPPGADCRRELDRGVDALTFTSPSTVRGFVSMGREWRDVASGAIVASIGPVTSAALEEAGFEGWIEAGEHTARGLVEALAGALALRRARKN